MKDFINIDKAVAQLLKEKDRFFTPLLENEKISLEYYAPKGQDLQTPHERDELYIIVSGSGVFFKNGERAEFQAGDVIYVPKLSVHRFEYFTDDFATWVIFFS